jgi:hypothetical protein
VAFVSDRGGRRGIWLVGPDGGTPRLLLAADVLDTVSLSPDGGPVYSNMGRARFEENDTVDSRSRSDPDRASA